MGGSHPDGRAESPLCGPEGCGKSHYRSFLITHISSLFTIHIYINVYINIYKFESVQTDCWLKAWRRQEGENAGSAVNIMEVNMVGLPLFIST